jgi:benzoate-CoA ligase
MLKVGGNYVSPIEVEEALVGHASVLEVAVIGAADADGLIKPRAYAIRCSDGQTGEAGEGVLTGVEQEVRAPYKYPRCIVFADDLPKTATGKIKRFRLRENA